MDPLDLLFAAMVAAYTVAAPYTKVEESFFVQAVHDALLSGCNIGTWDHLAFPGVVPRSFIGPLAIAALSWPMKWMFSGLALQIVVRLVLGTAVAAANARLRHAVQKTFGQRAAWWFCMFCICQFHYVFWTSRMLGNTLALVPLLVAQADWILCMAATDARIREHRYRRMAAVLAFTCVVLRFDSVVFAIPMLLDHISALTWRTVRIAFAAAVVSAALTATIDSWMWQSAWMWPEARVFVFNVIQRRSSEWGITPPLHYFIHFLPRLLLGSLPFAAAGIVSDSRVARLAAACLASIAIFSANGHKEWRFILPAVPIFNICAAVGVVRLRVYRLAAAACCASLAVAVSMAYISSLNYPGGHALSRLHTIESAPNVTVHIDTYAAMTGVTRFGQIRDDWIYDKTEGLEPGQHFENYTYLLTASPKPHAGNGFTVVAAQQGYSGIDIAPILISLRSLRSPITIRQSPLVWIMRNDRLLMTSN
ncbi:hypothetical protein LPJ64_001987 [Coemansia asiatica]|uniref:Mannosyltransferase n=1 Tax=Coemansia asiatica TaxID=1052880 RepID=A0A9W7XNU9_9FUNG|nr:hypothetical protein LPJ64_001987 [Coemansia asiatica]